MMMTDGEKMVYAATFALELKERGHSLDATRGAARAAHAAVDWLRHAPDTLRIANGFGDGLAAAMAEEMLQPASGPRP